MGAEGQLLVPGEGIRTKAHTEKRAQQAVLMGMPNMANPNGSVTFQAPKETKHIQLDPVFPERVATIGSNLDPK